MLRIIKKRDHNLIKIISAIAISAMSVAIICQPVKAETGTLTPNTFTIAQGETKQITFNELEGKYPWVYSLDKKSSKNTDASFNANTITITVGSDEKTDSEYLAGGHSFSIYLMDIHDTYTIYVDVVSSGSKDDTTTPVVTSDRDDTEYVEYTPPTPEELETIRLGQSFTNGFSHLSVGSSEAFMEFGRNGEAASLWQAGKKLGSFYLTDADGKAVNMSFIGIKTVEGKKYISLMAYSKAGDYQLNIDDEARAALIKAGLSGIMFGKTTLLF